MASRESFVQESLQRSNEYRLRHGVKALVLNRDLCRLSQEWAEVLSGRGSLKHNEEAKYKGEKVGENLAYSYDSAMSPTGSSMIDQWYNEVGKYSFNRQGFTPGTGHFTQLVWKNSREVGFGLGVKNGEHYLVANYYPAGNWHGEFDKNVFPAGSKGGGSSNSAGSRGGSNYGAGGCDDNRFSSNDEDFKQPKKSLFGGFFSNRGKGKFELDKAESFGSGDHFNDLNLSRSGNRFNDFNNNNNSLSNDSKNSNKNSDDCSTNTTVETKEENGWRTITTTTIKKTPQGTSKQTNIRREHL